MSAATNSSAERRTSPILAAFRARLQLAVDVRTRQLKKFFFGREALPGDLSLDALFQALPVGTTFVQIGANDGVGADPINRLVRERGWRGLFVEPIPYLFERLKKTYADVSGLKFLNLAVGESQGSMPFYFVDPDEISARNLPTWAGGIGSFSRTHITSHFGADIATSIREIRVPTASLAEIVLQAEGYPAVIQIDAEGYDINILRQVDLSKVDLRAVGFERKHMHPDDLRSMLIKFRANGFSTHLLAQDAAAIRK